MPTTDINDACKAIRDVWDQIRNDFVQVTPTGHYLDLTCVHRSPEEQFELYKKGREESSIMETGWRVVDKSKVVTNVDGHINKGAHNYLPSRAIDVCVVDNQTGKRLWDANWYKPLIEIAERYGLVEGGTWRTIKDWPHLEVKNFKTYTESV